jgi:hypothetical protein
MLTSAFLLALLLPVESASAQVPLDGSFAASSASRERLGGDFGLGGCLGTPTGLSGKLWLGSDNAVQFSLGGDWGQFRDLAGTADFLVHFRPINVEGDDFALPLYAGGGVKMDVNWQVPGGQLLLGPRVVLGGTVLVPTLPVDLFLEVAPTVFVYDTVGWVMDGQIGARYYF